MVVIGSKYEKNKSMLVEKINDSENIDLLIIEMEAHKQRCYFCHRSIPEGDKMFELTHYWLSRKSDVETIYYIDEICMGLARGGNNKNGD